MPFAHSIHCVLWECFEGGRKGQHEGIPAVFLFFLIPVGFAVSCSKKLLSSLISWHSPLGLIDPDFSTAGIQKLIWQLVILSASLGGRKVYVGFWRARALVHRKCHMM